MRRSTIVCLALLAGAPVPGLLAPRSAHAAERLRATVQKSDGTSVEIDVGRPQGVTAGTRFRVFTVGKVIRIPLTGTVTYSEGEPIGVIRVVEPGEFASRCVVESVEAGRRISPGLDAVYLSGPVSAGGPRTVSPEPPPTGAARPPAPVDPSAPRELGTATGEPSLPAPTAIVIAASPGTPAPGATVRLMARGLEGAKAGYRVNWSSRQGCFTADRTPTPLVTWIAPRLSGKHEIRAVVTLADGKMLEGRGLINVVGEPVIRKAVELERVVGYLAYQGKEPLRTQDVAFDEAGNTYFLDAKLRCVLRLGRRGGTSAAASRKACADGRLREPRALVVRKGRIYILDAERPYVKVFVGDAPAVGMGEGVKIGDPADLAVDARGFAYVVDRKRHCFHVFNTTGSYLHQRGARGQEQLGQFEEPVAIDTAPNGNLFVLDRKRKDIQVFDATYSVIAKINVRVRKGNDLMDLAVGPDGKSVHVLEGPRGIVARYSIKNEVIFYPVENESKFPGLPPKAMKMAGDGLGRVYVVGRSREGVFRYTADGHFAGSFAADKPSKVLGIAVDDAGRVAILDKKSPHIRLYDPDGWLVGRFGHSADAPAPYRQPKHIGMLRRGGAVVTLGQTGGSAFDTPKAVPSLHIFDAEGKVVRAVGPRGTQPGQFIDPADLDGDRSGNVYALDKDLFRISIYSRLGAGQTPERERAISRGSRQPREMLVPNRIAVDPDTGHLYIYDDKTRLIKKFSRDMDYIGMTGTEFAFRDVQRIRVDHMGFLWVFDRKLRELRRIDFRGNEAKTSLELPLRDTARDAIDFGLDASGRIYVLTAKDLVYVFR